MYFTPAGIYTLFSCLHSLNHLPVQFFDSLRDMDRLKCTAPERALPHLTHTFRDAQPFQCAAARECFYSNLLQLLRQPERF